MEFEGEVISLGSTEGKLLFEESKNQIEEKYTKRTFLEEIERFLEARDKTAVFLEQLSEQTTARYGITAGAIVEGYRMLVTDAGFEREVKNWTEQEHFCAEYAVKFVTERIAAQMTSKEQELSQSRSEDVVQVGRLLIRRLLKKRTGIKNMEKGAVILLKEDIDICELLTLNEEVTGLLLLRGKEYGHVNVLAKMRKLPMLIHVPKELIKYQGEKVKITEGKVLLLD